VLLFTAFTDVSVTYDVWAKSNSCVLRPAYQYIVRGEATTSAGTDLARPPKLSLYTQPKRTRPWRNNVLCEYRSHEKRVRAISSNPKCHSCSCAWAKYVEVHGCGYTHTWRAPCVKYGNRDGTAITQYWEAERGDRRVCECRPGGRRVNTLLSTHMKCLLNTALRTIRNIAWVLPWILVPVEYLRVLPIPEHLTQRLSDWSWNFGAWQRNFQLLDCELSFRSFEVLEWTQQARCVPDSVCGILESCSDIKSSFRVETHNKARTSEILLRNEKTQRTSVETPEIECGPMLLNIELDEAHSCPRVL